MNSVDHSKAWFMLGTWIVISALAVIAWDLMGQTESGRFLISRPELLLDYVRDNYKSVVRSFGWTLLESSAGLAIAVCFALGIGVASVFMPALTRLTHPLLVASQVIPFVCLAPLIILVFGPGPNGKAFLSSMMCFFPIATSILSGIRHAPKQHLEIMRLMGASKYLLIRHVIAPFTAPHFFSGLRVAAPFAVIGSIVAEFNGANSGIGKDLFISAKRLEPEMMMGALLSAAVCSAFLYGIVILFESSIGPWYKHSNRNEN